MNNLYVNIFVMKQKINILINEEARRLGLYYGFWNWFFIFKNELLELGIEVDFFLKPSSKFLDADHLFLNSRSFAKIQDRVNLKYIEEIYKK